MKITIGSRGSSLALWQANWVKDHLASAGHEVKINIIKTSGDRLQNAALAASGTKGLFIKEIEEALLAGQVDLAVHSMKDLPTGLPEGLGIAAVPQREDPRDALVSRGGLLLQDLPAGARIGTSSLRRQSQLLALRPDLEVVPMRGNVDTRLRKLERGDCEALVLAAAGLRRLGFASHITSWFREDEICPAVGQGALAIEIRTHNAAVEEVIAAFDHPATHRAIRAERAMLEALGGGCQLPIAAYAKNDSGRLHLTGVVADPAGTRVLRAMATGELENPEDLGRQVATELFGQGARELLSLPGMDPG
ncbi:MAG: hydroxymethylbilane synthase [Acidobacteria bacterium]|nr:MAG: hydroxymethylbilane synthase [Acidobacteriota bacterium]